jgi:hypothetical protein
LGKLNVDIQDQDPAASVGGAPSNPNRRRFASAGAKASGVILTLVSTPGMACVCRSPSGSLSGNLTSGHSTQSVVCNGVSPGYWKNWPDQWPPSCYPVTTSLHKATLFASVFPYGSTDLYKTGSMMDVLVSNDPAQDPYNLGMHLVAAYLNVKSNKINFFTVSTLKTMWHDLITYGYYSPAAGTKWYAYDIATYLTSTEN